MMSSMYNFRLFTNGVVNAYSTYKYQPGKNKGCERHLSFTGYASSTTCPILSPQKKHLKRLIEDNPLHRSPQSYLPMEGHSSSIYACISPYLARITPPAGLAILSHTIGHVGCIFLNPPVPWHCSPLFTIIYVSIDHLYLRA